MNISTGYLSVKIFSKYVNIRFLNLYDKVSNIIKILCQSFDKCAIHFAQMYRDSKYFSIRERTFTYIMLTRFISLSFECVLL